MRVLFACEESQTCTIAFRKQGHEAYSCDILPCSGGHPEWHLWEDVREVLKAPWDMMVGFPPCTYLTVTGNRWFLPKYKDRFPNREQQRQEAIEFFMLLANANIPLLAIENPIGIMSRVWRKPDQIIHPYFFGHPVSKATCLWLKGLPKLVPTNIVEPEYVVHRNGRRTAKWYFETLKLPAAERAKVRSKTFLGVAEAMANQWSQPIS